MADMKIFLYKPFSTGMNNSFVHTSPVMPETKDADAGFEVDDNWSSTELIQRISQRYNVPEILVKALLEMNRNSTSHENNDRSFILNLEEEIISFIKAPNVDSWKMVPLNSYYRLLTHKISEYYQLGHILSNDGFSMVLYKKNTSLINADENTKRNAKIDQSGKVKPLKFDDLSFDPQEKLSRISLKVIYERFHDDVQRLSKDEPTPAEPLPHQSFSHGPGNKKVLKRNGANGASGANGANGANGSNGANTSRNATDDTHHGKRHFNKYKSQFQYYPNYYYPPPQMLPPGPPGPPPPGAPGGPAVSQEYPQPMYYVPIIPQEGEMYYSPHLPLSGDAYVMYPPPPPELEQQLHKQRKPRGAKNGE